MALHLCVLAGFFSIRLPAQTLSPLSDEYSLGGALAGDQIFPALSIGPQGGCVVWQDNRLDGKYGLGVAALKLNANLAAISPVFRVNSILRGDQSLPQVAQLANGNTLFVWQSRTNGGKQNLFVRVLGANGKFLGADLPITRSAWTDVVRYSTNLYTYAQNRYARRTFQLADRIVNARELTGHAAVVPLPDGGALVAYESVRRVWTNTWNLEQQTHWNGTKTMTNDLWRPSQIYVDGMQDVFFQRLSATGKKVGAEVQVNQCVPYNQRNPAVAVLAGGGFVATWVCERPRSASPMDNFRVDIYARLFSGQGQPLGGEFLVSASDGLPCANPTVAPKADGGFTIVWSQQGHGLARWDVFGRSFSNDAAPAGDPFQLNAFTPGNQYAPRIVAAGDSQMVVWTSVGQDGSKEGVYGRLLWQGVPSGDEFRVNTTTVSRQMYPAVAADASGRFLAVWSSYVGESGFDLFGQQYMGPPPTTGGPGLVAASLRIVPEQSSQRQGNAASADQATVPANPGQVSSTDAALRVALGGSLEKLRLNWNTRAGVRYQVQVSANLKTWIDVGTPRVAAGVGDSFSIDRDQPAAFYRVIQLR